MSLFSDFIQNTNKEVLERVEKLVKEKGIKAKLEKETENLANQCANSLIDPEAPKPPSFKGVDFAVEDQDQFLLILDYFQSSGLQFTTQTIKYESQHPNITVDRKKLAEKYGLRSYDKTPLLVQMIEQRLKMIGNE
ncbi:hypothetical protein TVAG_512760 [Trichomonas vaginalis G3]|uniref:LisH domain-containing protein n=1 Tax=Trichomonas vaginalis (strain ATCC PRA-98 / G3) TaxID=412133 RepID=A2GA84_TRIV3|nr:hypothetical protein TVAGG3_0060790 [Trichomonas vaginalis G3]EAX85930.1 hypothetical protein TVAG_512760 [Trichomonas vaginalis G3]KAI5541990.1 hypothetical protein TVAGG3_0060790 [Trichomonas vaginalis G3]|eukprot:XP_001298860.1 hypothetical protein [Trichomonas vaginalis G3]